MERRWEGRTGNREREREGGNVVHRRSIVVALVAVAMALPTLVGTGTAGAQSEPERTCTKHQVPVALADNEPAKYQVTTWLCSQGPVSDVVQVLIPGGSYNHIYWDFPYKPELYSYAQAANRAGYTTLNIDRIGTGESDRPPVLRVDVFTNSNVVHQLVQKLRAGEIGGTSFEKVVLVGHSLGSGVAIGEAARYGDVDGVIVTGAMHGVNIGAPLIASSFYPALLDPKFGTSVPVGYLTSWPGTRYQAFYFPAEAEQEVIDLDDQTKDTVTPGEIATFYPNLLLSSNVHVPVFSVIGEVDAAFCTLPCGLPGSPPETEGLFYPADACLETMVVPGAGHDLNLHANAPDFHAAAEDWLARRIGGPGGEPPTQPCG